MNPEEIPKWKHFIPYNGIYYQTILLILALIFLSTNILLANDESKAKVLYYQALFKENENEKIKLNGELSKKFPDTEYGIASNIFLLHSKNDRKKMLELTKALQERYPDSPIGFYYSAWFKLFVDGNFLETIAEASTGISLNPNYPMNYYIRAIAYDQNKEDANALNDWDKYISFFPNDPRGYLQRGIAKSKLKQQTACRDFKTAEEKNAKFNQSQIESITSLCGDLKYYSEEWYHAKESGCEKVSDEFTKDLFTELKTKKNCSITLSKDKSFFATVVCPPNDTVLIFTAKREACENLVNKLYPK